MYRDDVAAYQFRTARNYEHISKTSEYELDVTACADYVAEPGRWLRVMPKGTLLKAGFAPDFVPT